MMRVAKSGLVGLLVLASGCSESVSKDVASVAGPDLKVITAGDYQRSDKFLNANLNGLVLNNSIDYQWIAENDNLYYKHQQPSRTEYRLVNSKTGEISPLFDHAIMAESLSKALGQEIAENALPIQKINRIDADTYSLIANFVPLICDLSSKKCDRDAVSNTVSPTEVLSPNGKYSIYTQDFNLWFRDVDSGQSRQLTFDGSRTWAYSKTPESSTLEVTKRRFQIQDAARVLWSPDGTKFVSYQLDERHVPELHLIQSIPEDGSYRPKLHSYHYDMPGEKPSLASYFIYDVISGKRTEINYPSLPSSLMTALSKGHISWSDDGKVIYMIDEQSVNGFLKFNRVDTQTGSVKTIIEEQNDKVILANAQYAFPPNVRVLSTGDVIWFSEKSGWGHLYLMDGDTGEEKYPLTEGDWLVRDILFVNESDGYLLVSGSGENKSEDPIFNKLYRVNLDGSGKELLTKDKGNHYLMPEFPQFSPLSGNVPASISPSGSYFVDYVTHPEKLGTWALRDSTGKLIVELAKEDVSMLPDFERPEAFSVRAVDDSYDLYGVLLKPHDFDELGKYPIIEFYYPGPQAIMAPKAMSSKYLRSGLIGDAQALAQLGFVVIMMDGRGTPWRSKAFMDLSYRNMEKAGYMEDHVHAIKELAKTRPWMDIEKVGLFGSSAGGFATARGMLDYPEFYKVGVSSAGNHEQRINVSLWGETFHGKYGEVDYDKVFVGAKAENLKGKLLLAHGEMDDNVHPAATMRLADSLIKAGKQFDMLIMPGVEHGIAGRPYFQRITQNYFLKHLMGAQLPDEVNIQLPTH